MRTHRLEINHIKPYDKPATDYGEEEANRMAKEDLTLSFVTKDFNG